MYLAHGSLSTPDGWRRFRGRLASSGFASLLATQDCDLGPHLVARYGDRPDARELAAAQAACYGIRFLARRATSRPDLLEDVRTRTGRDGRRRWPDARNRFCTSDHNRSVGRKLLTELVRELALPRGTPARVLTVMGLRAQESRGRARRPVFSYDQAASGKGTVRQVWQWLPIHHWSVEQVWADIHATGVPYAWVYDAGLSPVLVRLLRAGRPRGPYHRRPAAAGASGPLRRGGTRDWPPLPTRLGHGRRHRGRTGRTLIMLVAQTHGMSVDSTAWLTAVLRGDMPAGFDLADLTVVTAMTGDESHRPGGRWIPVGPAIRTCGIPAVWDEQAGRTATVAGR